MQKWEYKLIFRRRSFVDTYSLGNWDIDIEKMLPILGEQGFELVAVSPRASAPLDFRAGVTTEEVWVFKRSKS